MNKDNNIRCPHCNNILELVALVRAQGEIVVDIDDDIDFMDFWDLDVTTHDVDGYICRKCSEPMPFANETEFREWIRVSKLPPEDPNQLKLFD